MPAPLDRTDFQALVDLLADLQAFRTEDRRWTLVDESLVGLPRAAAARGGLDLRDPPRTAAVSLVVRLGDFGCLGDRHALALVLETVRRGCSADLWPVLDPIIARLAAHCRPVPTAAILHLSGRRPMPRNGAAGSSTAPTVWSATRSATAAASTPFRRGAASRSRARPIPSTPRTSSASITGPTWVSWSWASTPPGRSTTTTATAPDCTPGP